jgi:hypothetical protein
MEKTSKIILSETEIKKLKNKCIASGTEGRVYRIGNGLLYKLYRSNEELSREVGYSSEHNINNLYTDSNILTAMERQKNVHLTSLPVCPIYDDKGKYIGCALKDHGLCLPIHSITMLPRKKQISIIKQLLSAVKELCDNNIYPQDLATKEIDGKPHTNILIKLNGKPEIIDLDGKSTIYSRERNESLEYSTYVSLTALISEILYDIDTKEDRDYVDTEYEINKLTNYGMPYDLAESMLRYECDYEALNEIVGKSV